MSKRAPVLLAATLALAGILGGHVVIETASSDPTENGLVTLLMARDWPVLAHLLVALPALLALAGLLLSRRTLAVPVPKIGVPLALLGGLVWAAALFADNKASALLGAVEWSGYGLVFFAVVAGGGRAGGRLLLGAIALGGVAAAALAVRQYGEIRAFDPNFRVQGPWNNPNALGAYLGIALVAALALAPGAERLGKLAALGGGVLIALGLALTQSRGAYLSTGFGLLIWLVVLGSARSKETVRGLVGSLVAVALGAALAFVVTRPPAQSGGRGGAFDRLGNSAEVSVQSVGFRRLLWRSAIELARREPLGKGLNSFGPRSAQPGLVTQTQLAHSTPLQLAAEVSPLGAGLWLGFFGIVAFVASRGLRRLSEERKGILAGAAGALAGALAHNGFDSDAYYFGLGLTLFALAGILLLAASDTSAPELVPTNWRFAGGFGIVTLVGLWIMLGQMDRVAAVARGAAMTGRPGTTEEALASLGPLVEADGRLLTRKALIAGSYENRLEVLKAAARLAPTTRNYRALATDYARAGNVEGAVRAYEAALRLDPNNLPALTQLRKLYEADGRSDEARRVAERTIAVEQTTYYTVRSQPELIPVQTADARLSLAETRRSNENTVGLLLPALAIYQEYARTTVPVVVRFDDGSGTGDYAGETRARAEEVLLAGRRTIAHLKGADYGDTARLADAEAGFARADALLRSKAR